MLIPPGLAHFDRCLAWSSSSDAPAAKSAEGREHLLVGREAAGRLLGVREPAIHGNLEHTTAGPVQLHLRAGCRLLNQTCRRTGARFIASHSAIFDLNLHKLLSRLPSRLLKQQPPRPSRRDPLPSPKPGGLHHDTHRVDQSISKTDITARHSYASLGGPRLHD
jgi:hypothetical protein